MVFTKFGGGTHPSVSVLPVLSCRGLAAVSLLYSVADGWVLLPVLTLMTRYDRRGSLHVLEPRRFHWQWFPQPVKPSTIAAEQLTNH